MFTLFFTATPEWLVILHKILSLLSPLKNFSGNRQRYMYGEMWLEILKSQIHRRTWQSVRFSRMSSRRVFHSNLAVAEYESERKLGRRSTSTSMRKGWIRRFLFTVCFFTVHVVPSCFSAFDDAWHGDHIRLGVLLGERNEIHLIYEQCLDGGEFH